MPKDEARRCAGDTVFVDVSTGAENELADRKSGQIAGADDGSVREIFTALAPLGRADY